MQKFILILFVGLLGVIVATQTEETSVVANDVVLENVEALADDESSLPVFCDAPGDYNCPGFDKKFGFIYIGYGLR